jgi:hypothetical protein
MIDVVAPPIKQAISNGLFDALVQLTIANRTTLIVETK